LIYVKNKREKYGYSREKQGENNKNCFRLSVSTVCPVGKKFDTLI